MSSDTSPTVASNSKLDAEHSADRHYEGIVSDVLPLYVRVYVPQFGICAIPLTDEFLFPAVGTLLRFHLKKAEPFIARLGIAYQASEVEVIGTATKEQLLEVHKILGLATSEHASDAQPGPSSSSSWRRPQPQATSSAEQEASAGLHYEGVVYEADPHACIYVSCLRKTVVAFTSDAFRPPAVYPQQELPGAQEPAHSDRRSERHDHLLPASDDEQQVETTKPTFAAPENWIFTQTERKATDLLGVAIAAANGTTAFYTRLGTVEIPGESQLGVWVRMDVTLTEGRFVQGDDDVLHIEQLVPPPMDTRVIRGKRVMLVAEVEKHSDGVGNQYLGAVLDPLSLLPRDSQNRIFVVELEFDKGCFLVIKCHKPSAFGESVTVALEESAYPFPEDHRGLDVQEGIIEYAQLLQLQHDM